MKTKLQNGEQVIHTNDLVYLEACETGLNRCLSLLNDFSNDFDGARVGNDSSKCIADIKAMMNRRDPLKGTTEASYVHRIGISLL